MKNNGRIKEDDGRIKKVDRLNGRLEIHSYGQKTYWTVTGH